MFPSGSHASFLRIRASLNLHLSCALEANTVSQAPPPRSHIESVLLHLKYFWGILWKEGFTGQILQVYLFVRWSLNLPIASTLNNSKFSKVLKQFGADQSLFIFLGIFGQDSFFLFFCFGFRGLVKGSGEVKSSSLMSNRIALCCFPFWIDKKSYTFSDILVVCAGQFWRRDCSSERAMFHAPFWGWR